jgi:prepilin-type N-terminal cleavage/methylation domain-containing protein
MIKRLFGFTLAEVLISMSIIGVVAAMTIPTLHYNYKRKEYSTKLKKFYSTMENAVVNMEASTGSFREMKRLTSYGENFDWYMTYLDPYIGHAYVKANSYTVYYKDGSKLDTFFPGSCMDVIYDVNGDKRPNSEGYDRFRFLFCFDDGSRKFYFNNKDIFFGTYGNGVSSQATTRENMAAKCKSSPPFCTRLLQNDQWEFKSDYPFKF